MEKNHKPRRSKIQVFVLTMDSAEDQDELNRLYRKPGEDKTPPLGPWLTTGRPPTSPEIGLR
jgi:hypothetical protein